MVVRGEGPTFSAGIDLRLLGGEEVEGEEPLPSPADPGFEDWIAECQEGFDWLRHPSIVSVAAVHGHAIGAGFQLALACDLRILADDARLSMREPTLGLVPDLLGTKPLVNIAGLPRALELCLTGRSVAAEEAQALRLAELVVPLGRARRRGGRPRRRDPRPGPGHGQGDQGPAGPGAWPHAAAAGGRRTPGSGSAAAGQAHGRLSGLAAA